MVVFIRDSKSGTEEGGVKEPQYSRIYRGIL